jgi:hypothetical protein
MKNCGEKNDETKKEKKELKTIDWIYSQAMHAATQLSYMQLTRFFYLK